MGTLTIAVVASLLSCLLALPAAAQPPIIVEVLAMEGDALSSGIVSTLYAATSNPNGEVAAIGQGTLGSIEFRFTEGAGYQESTSLNITGITQTQIGFSDAGQVAWVPVVSGYDVLYVDTTEIVHPGDDISVTGINIIYDVKNIRRPHYTASGALYTWLSDLFTEDHIVRYQNSTWSNVVSEDDTFDVDGYEGYLVDSVSKTFDAAYDGSTDHVVSIVEIAPAIYNTNPAGVEDKVTADNDIRVLIDQDTWVVFEGDDVGASSWSSSSSSLPLASTFTHVAINGDQEVMVGGTTGAGAAISHYSSTLSNPTQPLKYTPGASLFEGTTLDGAVLGNEVHTVSINDEGHVAFMWEDATGDHLVYIDCNPDDLTDAHLVLREGDLVDFDPSTGDPDGTEDGEITFIAGSVFRGARVFDLATATSDKGEIALGVQINGDYAVLRIPYDCDCEDFDSPGNLGDLSSQDWDDDGWCGASDPCPLDANHEDLNPINGTPDCAESAEVPPSIPVTSPLGRTLLGVLLALTMGLAIRRQALRG
jgi:hypothetical protein